MIIFETGLKEGFYLFHYIYLLSLFLVVAQRNSDFHLDSSITRYSATIMLLQQGRVEIFVHMRTEGASIIHFNYLYT